MRRHVIALFCLSVFSHQLQDVRGDFWQKVGREAERLGGRIRDEAKRVSTNVNEEFQNRIIPQVKSWADRDNNDDAVELKAGDVVTSTCVGLHDASVSLSCHLAGASVDCSAPAQIGTMVDMTCASGYVQTHRHRYTRITCNETLLWSNRLIKCIPDCGRENPVGGQEFISRGQDVQDLTDFAWHVGIFQLNETRLYDQICGGSIITPSFVLSAAHCFWDLSTRRMLEKELFSVAAGKLTIDWYKDDANIQRRNLSVIHLGPRFAGDRHFLAYDIALVKLDHDIVLSLRVNTICIDFDDKLEDRHLQPGKNGSIAGWGITEHNEPSERLKSVRLPYIPVEDCENIVEAKFLKYLTHDKFCAGYRNQGTSICPGDSGGGYTFPQETPEGRRYYLRGIASVGHRPRPNTGIKCQSEQVAGFTRVSLYRSWIENIVFPDE